MAAFNATLDAVMYRNGIFMFPRGVDDNNVLIFADYHDAFSLPRPILQLQDRSRFRRGIGHGLCLVENLSPPKPARTSDDDYPYTVLRSALWPTSEQAAAVPDQIRKAVSTHVTPSVEYVIKFIKSLGITKSRWDREETPLLYEEIQRLAREGRSEDDVSAAAYALLKSGLIQIFTLEVGGIEVPPEEFSRAVEKYEEGFMFITMAVLSEIQALRDIENSDDITNPENEISLLLEGRCREVAKAWARVARMSLTEETARRFAIARGLWFAGFGNLEGDIFLELLEESAALNTYRGGLSLLEGDRDRLRATKYAVYERSPTASEWRRLARLLSNMQTVSDSFEDGLEMTGNISAITRVAEEYGDLSAAESSGSVFVGFSPDSDLQSDSTLIESVDILVALERGMKRYLNRLQPRVEQEKWNRIPSDARDHMATLILGSLIRRHGADYAFFRGGALFLKRELIRESMSLVLHDWIG